MKIFLVPHFHYDTIYSKTYEEYLEVSLKNLMEAITLLEEDNSYFFLIEQTILLEEFWQRFPQYHSKIKKYIKNGRIEISPGMFVMPDMNLISGESLIRQIERGGKFLQKFGKKPKVCWIADCWGHHRQIPQILKKSGYIGYAFSRAMIRKTPFLHFRWEGIDGTKILTHWMATGYDGLVFREYTYLQEKEEEKMWGYGKDPIEFAHEIIEEKLEILKKYKAVDIILLPNGADFARPQKITSKVVKEWNKKNPDKEIEISTPEKYFQYLSGEKIPVISEDFNPLFTGTYTSRVEIKQLNRYLENKIFLLELLHTFMSVENTADISEHIGLMDELEYYVLFNQFHDIICGSILDEGYRDVMEKYKNAERIIEELQEKIISGLTVEKENSIALLNPCSFPRKDTGTLKIQLPENKNSVEIYENNKKIPSQVVERKEKNIKVKFELSTSGFEMKNLKFLFTNKKPENLLLPPYKFKNSFYEIRISENGLISSLKLKNGTELVNPEKPYFGDLIFQRDNGDFWVYYEQPVAGGERFTNNMYDPYSENVDISKQAIFLRSAHPDVKIEKGNVADIVQLSGKIKFWESIWEYEHYYFLYKKFPFIDFKTIFYPMGRNYRIRVAFPTSIKNGEIRREIPFGFERQDEGEYPALNWIDYSDKEEKGICLINKGLPGNNVTEGVLTTSLFRAVDMGANKAKSVTGYAEGKKHCFEYRILPFVPKDKSYKPYLAGILFNQPFLTLPGLKWGNKKVSLSVTPSHFPVTKLKMCDNGFLIRIYEPEGKKTKVNISMKSGTWEFYKTDLTGEKREKAGQGTQIKVNFAPFEIKTLFLVKQ